MNRYRRFLLDMHIPDWDPAFLSKYDPAYLVTLYKKARIDSVMLYCQSHTGLAYWPVSTGKIHRAMHERDFVGEMIELLHGEGIEVFSYYSLIFNNEAFMEHPQWRFVSSAEMKGGAFSGNRYGLVCPNNREYRDFALSQVRELISGYDFDGAFFDMTFWPSVCICESCRDSYRREQGAEIPKTVDWFSGDWCRFQTAREKWLIGFAGIFTECVKAIKPDMPVFHNFAVSLFNWTRGISFQIADQNDFLGGDFYGGPLEQQLISRFMVNLSNNTPIEFMTSSCTHLVNHVRLKSFQQMEIQALASLLFSAAFRFIDGINPDGTVNPAVYEQLEEIYAELALYTPYLGGEPLEEIAVYVSDNSKMNFTENGKPLTDPTLRSTVMPHLEAVKGAVRVLQEAHLPFGVITKKQLSGLSKYKVIILANLLRLEQRETQGFREYVKQGGCLYASRYTSLTDASGVRHEDFMLQDLFGCHCSGEQGGSINYIKPLDKELVAAIFPQKYVSHNNRADKLSGMLRIAADSGTKVLAKLTLAYAAPDNGSVFDQRWASIHSSPPWEDSDTPLIVENRYGRGRVIYCAADIESVESRAHTALLTGLIRRLLGKPPVYEADTHPSVWMTVFHQPEKRRYLVSFLNYQTRLPVLPISRLPFRLFIPREERLIRLFRLPDKQSVHFSRDEEGFISAEIKGLDKFTMIAVAYEKGL